MIYVHIKDIMIIYIYIDIDIDIHEYINGGYRLTNIAGSTTLNEVDKPRHPAELANTDCKIMGRLRWDHQSIN